jgi:hypothetical protein
MQALQIMRGTFGNRLANGFSFALANAGIALRQVMHAALKNSVASLLLLAFTDKAFPPLFPECDREQHGETHQTKYK